MDRSFKYEQKATLFMLDYVTRRSKNWDLFKKWFTDSLVCLKNW